jgi:hypothetical protein
VQQVLEVDQVNETTTKEGSKEGCQGAGPVDPGRHSSAFFGLFRDMCLIGFSKMFCEEESKKYILYKKM